MKKNNKSRKGFTIVELVIVIAVIAILAGVLIPTFSGVVTKANNSAVLQEARNVYTEMYAIDFADGKLDGLVDGTTAVPQPTSYKGTAAYAAADGAVTSFTYTKDSITATLNVGTGKWTAN